MSPIDEGVSVDYDYGGRVAGLIGGLNWGAAVLRPYLDGIYRRGRRLSWLATITAEK
jgi:hypothetical protein